MSGERPSPRQLTRRQATAVPTPSDRRLASRRLERPTTRDLTTSDSATNDQRPATRLETSDQRLATDMQPQNPDTFLEDAAHFPGGHATGVVFPRTAEEVADILAEASAVLPIGAQSSLTGGATPMGELIVSTSKMRRIVETTASHVTVEAGVDHRGDPGTSGGRRGVVSARADLHRRLRRRGRCDQRRGGCDVQVRQHAGLGGRDRRGAGRRHHSRTRARSTSVGGTTD